MILHLGIGAALLAAGYGIGRYQPAEHLSEWANWTKYDQNLRKHSARWWAMFVILSAENIGWLIAHPLEGWDAWKHRNDPPPPRSPAVRIVSPEDRP